MRNRDKTKTCSKVDSVQRNVYALGIAHFDRGLACIRWRGKAQVDEKKGFHGPIDFRPFRAAPPRCANETRLRAVPNLIQSKAMYKPRVSRTLIGGLHAYDGVGRLKSVKSRAVTDPLIPGHFGQFSLGAHRDKT